MSDTNQVSLRYVEETVAGVTPATPALKEAKLTGTSDMGFTPETTISELIRSDRQVTDLILVNGSVGGQFDSELISVAHDDFIEAALQSTGWSTETAAITNTAVTIVGSVITDDVGGGFAGISEGDWIEINQAGSDPSYYRVASVVSDDLTVEGTISETATGGTDIVVTVGSMATNASDKRTFTIEKAYLDQTAVLYEYIRGMEVGTFSVTASASSIVNCAFGFTGRSHEATETRFAGATETAQDGSIFNASSNVASIGEGGAPGIQIATELSMEVNNNLREKNAIGTLGAFDVGSGEFNVSGSIQTFFEDKTMLDKLINNTITSISFGFTDGAGNALIFDMPAVKFSEGVPEVSGKNEDVFLNLSYQAFRDTTLGYTLKVTRFTA